MKPYIKKLIICGACLIPIAFVVVFSIPFNNKTPISCVGSSGVKPFVEQIASKYAKENKKVDVTVEAGGSGFGIEEIAKGFAKIGNASKNPFDSVKGDEKGSGFRQQWKDNRIKTVSIGQEAICMVYIPPKNFEFNNDVTPTNLLSLTADNIVNFFRIFSGINDGIIWREDNNIPVNSMWHFVNNNIKSQLSTKQISSLKNTNIIPYVRAGGSTTSGTAESFYKCPLIKDRYDELSAKQQNAFHTGDYGTSFHLEQTNEANSRAWTMFSASNMPGEMVYLSSGFVSQANNWDIIQQKHYGVCAYQGTQYTADIKDGYKWLRPLNCMFSLKNITTNDDPIAKFIVYLIKHVENCKKNDDAANNSMFDSFDEPTKWKSDVELASLRSHIGPQPIWDWDNDTIFGAIYG